MVVSREDIPRNDHLSVFHPRNFPVVEVVKGGHFAVAGIVDRGQTHEGTGEEAAVRLVHVVVGEDPRVEPDRRSGVGAPDYLRYMFSRRVEVEPGSTFCYSSADSDLAGRMLEQAAGMRLGEYLYGMIFSKLDQGWPVWECDPQGHPIAGGGIYMSLANMLKLGQVYLNDGTWHGTRIVSESWVKQASGKQIDTPYSNIWTCGYGYQFWMSPYEGAYRADGAYGQITTVLPKQGLVVAIQCPESGDFDNIVRPALHEHLLLPLTA